MLTQSRANSIQPRHQTINQHRCQQNALTAKRLVTTAETTQTWRTKDHGAQETEIASSRVVDDIGFCLSRQD